MTTCACCGAQRPSFLYPPYLASAQEVIDYYEHIEIDDAIVSKFIDAYGAARAIWAEDHLRAYDLDLQFKLNGNKEKVEKAHWAEFHRIAREHPTFVNPIFARDITRAVQMARIANWSLQPDEEGKLLDSEITLTNGANERVGYLAKRYLVGHYEADLV